MDANSVSQSVGQWVGSLSKVSRLAIVVVVMIVALIVIQSSGLETKQPVCSLFPDCHLQPAEINRMQIGFGASGLNEFQIVDGEIRVPEHLRGEYLRVANENGLLPRGLERSEAPAPNLNPFLSRTQQLLVQESQKKQQICEMINRLPYVADVWMEMDTAKSANVFNADQQSAVITIQPAENELDQTQIATIRQIVSGAFAGMDTTQIVVTDLSAGIAYGGQNATESNKLVAQQVAWQKTVRTQQHDYENRIRVALSEFDGVEFDVHISPGDVNNTVPSPTSFIAKPAPKQTNKFKTAPFEQPRAGTNGTASITDHDPPKKAVIDTTKMLRPIEPAKTTAHPEIAVDVRIPTRVVNKIYPTKPKGIFESSTETDQQVLRANFQKLKTQVISKIRPVLPVSSFANSATYPISVSLVQAEQPSVATAANASTWFGKHMPSLIVLLLGGTLLFVVIRTGTPVEAQSDAQLLLSLHSAPQDSHPVAESDPESDLTKQQLAELIDQDPEAAAKVIKSWIRNAA